jgi:hypothetical protein
MRVLLVLCVLAACGKPKRPPGPIVSGEPSQVLIALPGWEVKGYRVSALADFSLRALVLGVSPYWFDRSADLSPADFAVGWGPMSDPSIVEQFGLSQSGRFLYMRGKQYPPPIPFRELSSHVANLHMIPADAEMRKAVKAVRPQDVIVVNGYLVEVAGKDGFRWKSSVSREDAGAGACELVWVRHLSIE